MMKKHIKKNQSFLLTWLTGMILITRKTYTVNSLRVIMAVHKSNFVICLSSLSICP